MSVEQEDAADRLLDLPDSERATRAALLHGLTRAALTDPIDMPVWDGDPEETPNPTEHPEDTRWA